MSDIDRVAPNYRRAMRKWPDAPTLTMSYEALDSCFSGNSHGLVENIKAFIESVCRTIIGELTVTKPPPTQSTTELLVKALELLGFTNVRGASTLSKVLSGFNRLSDALGEMRNESGPIAHGRDGFLDAVSIDHTRAFLHVGDAILGVLLSATEGKLPDLKVTREPYENFQHLNDRIDQTVSVKVAVEEGEEAAGTVLSVFIRGNGEPVELRIEPSRLLFGVDREAYLEMLQTAGPFVVERDEYPDESESAAAASKPGIVRKDKATAASSITTLLPEYSGVLDAVRDDLAAFLVTEGTQLPKPGVGAEQLVASLLGTAEKNMHLDWQVRETVQAGMRVAFNRVLVQFGFDRQYAKGLAARIVGWLGTHAPDLQVTSLRFPIDQEGNTP